VPTDERFAGLGTSLFAPTGAGHRQTVKPCAEISQRCPPARIQLVWRFLVGQLLEPAKTARAVTADGSKRALRHAGMILTGVRQWYIVKYVLSGRPIGMLAGLELTALEPNERLADGHRASKPRWGALTQKPCLFANEMATDPCPTAPLAVFLPLQECGCGWHRKNRNGSKTEIPRA
jgi:hypothetical protein